MTPAHGTASNYTNTSCRCTDCREAWRTAIKAMRAHRRSERVLRNGRWTHPTAPHGKQSTYTNYSCRCRLCTQAHTDAAKTKQ